MGRKADLWKAEDEIERSQKNSKKAKKTASPKRPATLARATRPAKPKRYELEEQTSAARKPRKTTRKSPEHVKTDAVQRTTQVTKLARPSVRAQSRRR